jgi:hypothetical protein
VPKPSDEQLLQEFLAPGGTLSEQIRELLESPLAPSEHLRPQHFCAWKRERKIGAAWVAAFMERQGYIDCNF